MSNHRPNKFAIDVMSGEETWDRRYFPRESVMRDAAWGFMLSGYTIRLALWNGIPTTRNMF